MRPFVLAIAGIGLTAFPPSAAFADGALSPLCSQLGFQNQREIRPSLNLIMSCQKSLVNREWLLDISDDVRSRLIGELVAGATPQPAGLTMSPEEERARLYGNEGIVIVPAVDATPARRWNTWVDGKYSRIETDNAVSGTDGDQVNVLVGVDYKITDRFVFGLLGTFEASDLETGVLPPAETKTEGYGGGAYAGFTLTDHLVYSGIVTGTFIDTDISFAPLVGSTDSDRLSVTNGITGYWYFGTTRLSPSLTFAWQKEWQDAFIDSGGNPNPSQTLETGILTFGNVLGHTFSLDNGMSVEPWVGANLDWTLINRAVITGVAVFPTDETLDLRLQAGLNWTLAENVQLALTGEVSGLLLSDTDTYAGEANIAIQF
jgi:outer membrane autotransporter protein